MSTPQEKAKAKKRKLAEESVETLCFDPPDNAPRLYVVECSERVFAPPGKDVHEGECHAGPHASVVAVCRSSHEAQALVRARHPSSKSACPRGEGVSHVLTFRGVALEGKAGKKVGRMHLIARAALVLYTHPTHTLFHSIFSLPV